MSHTKISINEDIAIAKTMPSYYYTDPYYYSLTINNIFKNSWQIIKNDIDLKKINPINFLSDSINEPLLISYKDKKYNLISNVCTHRANILCAHPINAKTIKCNYHGRAFDNCGKVIKSPGFKKNKNFPDDNDNLKNYPIKQWKQFLFYSLGGKIDINEVLVDIGNRLFDYPFDMISYDQKKSKTYILNANWSLYCENYLEGFHIPFIHKGLNSDINLNTYKTQLLENGVLQYTEDKNKKVYAYYYWIFPNIMLNFYSWGLSLNIIEPISIDKTRINFLSYPINGKEQPIDNASSLDNVEKEDQEIVLNVQRGVKTLSYSSGKYSAEHELGIHHFHRLISKYLQ